MASQPPDLIALEVFGNQYISVAEEMGATLGRTAYSPNIKERRDFSCACFLGDGRMIAQAAHIPVHLGAMPASVRAALTWAGTWQPGDLVILNDPYLGGTHLPDITMVSPVFVDELDGPCFFVASRAHHADVGGMSPGSMSLATELYQEGLILPPVRLVDAGITNEALLAVILRNVRTPAERRGDLAAQMASHRVGAHRLSEIVARYGLDVALEQARALLEHAEKLTRAAIARMPRGVYRFEDAMDDDGYSSRQGPKIRVSLTVQGDELSIDFSGSSPSVPGSINAVRSITESATWYAVLCILGSDMLVNSGTFVPVHVSVPRGSFLDAEPPRAVAGGNVETSQRIVDAVLGAASRALPDLIPAASQGTMNNIAVGGTDPEVGGQFAYYETIGGGCGAGPLGDGLSGVQVHMTNTLNTPVEAVEFSYPLRVRRYAIRRGSGGRGRHRGGDGLIRVFEFLCPAHVTILSERRRISPYGLAGGLPGKVGRNLLIRGRDETELTGKVSLDVVPGDIIAVQTPGGGGWGSEGSQTTDQT